jgi:endonuclease YncB( thermonuclease family)
MKKLTAAAAFALFAFPAFAADVPDCAGGVEVADAHIVRTERNAALILSDGRAVHLEGIRLPLGRTDHAPQFLADQALAVLGDMANDHELVLTAVAPKEDRYDRIRAQAFSGAQWLQVALLKRGLARVAIAPDRVECAAELYDAEAQARATHSGIWALSAYAIRTPQGVGSDIGTFQVVQGTVQAVTERNGQTILDFGGDPKATLTVVLSADDMANFRSIGVDPRGYAGKTLRVRGVVQNRGGPMLDIANPLQVEMVQ